MNFYLLFIYFLIYSIIGWMCEVVYCSVPARYFINRGVLHGPYCPIYGFGALAVLFFLSPFRRSAVLVYIAGVIITSILEYITSFLMEKIFHSSFWDYSDHRFNLHGRVCLLNSLLFGVLSILLMYVIHPFIERTIALLPADVLTGIATAGMIVLAVDITSTGHALTTLRMQLRHLDELGKDMAEKIAKVSAERRSLLPDFRLELEQRKEKLASHVSFGSRRLISAFPKLRSTDLNDNLILLRHAIDTRKKARRAQKSTAKK